MTSPTLPQIVEGLTKASRRAIVMIGDDWTVEGSPGPKREYVYSLWWGRDGGKGLVEKPVFVSPFGWKWRLTPLGLEVRTHLLSLGKGV